MTIFDRILGKTKVVFRFIGIFMQNRPAMIRNMPIYSLTFSNRSPKIKKAKQFSITVLSPSHALLTNKMEDPCKLLIKK